MLLNLYSIDCTPIESTVIFFFFFIISIDVSIDLRSRSLTFYLREITARRMNENNDRTS